jgi:L-asparaginase
MFLMKIDHDRLHPGTQQTAMKIKIFTTGGTIDKIYFDQKSEYQVGDPQAGGVLERANVVIEYEVESILRKDSLDLTDEDRNVIKRKVYAESCNRILITHGTDSMIQTAKSLGRESGKTIVLTGSMYPAEFRNSDAIFNIGCAITAVQILTPGVYIAMNGRIFNPYCSKKNMEKNRFEELKS